MSTTRAPLLVERDGGVMVLTLNRPEVLNSLTGPLLDELTAAVGEAGEDAAVRAVVIRGSGRAFCAGQDLRVAQGEGPIDIRRDIRAHYVPLVVGLAALEKPVIAAVNGVAAGAGLALAAAADLRVAAAGATFIAAFVRVGLVPDAGVTFFLSRLIGHGRAMEMCLLGDTVSAADALRMGLVNRVVDDDALDGAVSELAARLAAGPRSVGLTKRALTLSLGADLAHQLQNEEDMQAAAADTSDFREGVSAFLEKRSASFRGR